MAPETVCLVMQTLYKSTLNEAFIIRQIVDAVVISFTLLFLRLCFNVLGANRGPTDRIQHINKHSLICQVDTIDFLSEKHSLRKPPHAFGSELVKKSETVKAC